MNKGKEFEQEFKMSIPNEIWYYRLKDGTASWGANKCPKCGTELARNTRFQTSNISDCHLYKCPSSFYIELKNTKENRLNKASVRQSQIMQMTDATKHNGQYAGLLVRFELKQECYYIGIEQFVNYLEQKATKSMPYKAISEQGIRLEGCLKRTKMKYNIMELLIKIESACTTS